MPADFNADEVFEMALQIERNGSLFYRHAAEQTDNPGLKEVLTNLAEMEDDHERLFADLKAKLPPGVAPEIEYDPAGEVALYLRAVADTHVFNVYADRLKELSVGADPAEILRTALSFEKDSVAFFLGLQQMVPQHLGKAEVEALVKEEMAHIVQITAALKEAQAES